MKIICPIAGGFWEQWHRLLTKFHSVFLTKAQPKAFTGLLRCAECGGAITAEIQKGHTYYRCTKKSRATVWCLQPYVREEVLDAEISSLLKPYSLPSDWAD